MISDEARARAADGVDDAGETQRLLSSDGSWWWNGRRWVAAATDDGLWRWDGTRWNPTVNLDGKRPEDLATTLALLAEERYADAGAILAENPRDWRPRPQLRELVDRAQEIRRQLSRLEEDLHTSDGGRGLLGRRALGPEERRHITQQHEEVSREYRTLTARIGRGAPQPSTKEADDLLATARMLDERAAMLTAGLAEVDEAERMRADAAVAAQKELAAAEDARVKALQRARKAVDLAEAAHASAVSDARARLSAVLTPGTGELKAGLGPLRLHESLLETSSGRLPVAGLAAYADTAPQLWRDHREQLSDLLLLEGPEAENFRTALTHRSAALFLLIYGQGGATLLSCPAGQEKAARRFAAKVTEQAAEATRARNERLELARKAEAELDAIIRDRSPIDAAEADLARTEADPALLGAIDDARQRLERARADTPELIEARRKLLEIATRLTSPPEPLQPVGGPAAPRG
jgi:hypothetical protein